MSGDFPVLRITAESDRSHVYKVFLDGKDISHFVSQLDLSVDVNGAEAVITLPMVHLEMDEGIKTKIMVTHDQLERYYQVLVRELESNNEEGIEQNEEIVYNE